MKHRASILVGLLAVTAPLGLEAVDLCPAPLAAPTAHAQPSDAATTLAREKFLDGVKAYDSGRFEEARSLFLQSYAITRHPAVLLNLGLAELKTGHNTDAGTHLQQFLREHRSAPEDQRQAARVGISDAQKRTGYIIVMVDLDGAQVSVDDVNVGTSPLLDPVFVEPGDHNVTATMSGRTARSKVSASRGTAAAANLSLRAMGVSAPAAPPPTRPTSGATAPGTPPPATGGPASGGYPSSTPQYPPTEPGNSGTAIGFGGPTPPPASGSGRQGFFDWYTQKPGAWVLSGVAGVGLIGGVVSGIVMGVNDGAVSDQTSFIMDEVNRNSGDPSSDGYIRPNPDGSYTPCGPEDQPGLDSDYYHSNCEVLRDNIAARDGAVISTVVFAGVFVAGLAGTIIYYFADADSEPAQASTDGVRLVGIAPVITPTDRGIGLVGTF